MIDVTKCKNMDTASIPFALIANEAEVCQKEVLYSVTPNMIIHEVVSEILNISDFEAAILKNGRN